MRALRRFILKRHESIRHEFVDRVQPLDVSLQKVVLVLYPVFNQILKLFHFNLHNDLIDLLLLGYLGSATCLPGRGLDYLIRDVLEKWIRLKEILLPVEILRLEKQFHLVQ